MIQIMRAMQIRYPTGRDAEMHIQPDSAAREICAGVSCDRVGSTASQNECNQGGRRARAAASDDQTYHFFHRIVQNKDCACRRPIYHRRTPVVYLWAQPLYSTS
jgi:hypothetical protein